MRIALVRESWGASADKHTIEREGGGVRGCRGDVRSEPVYRFYAAGLATGEEAVHAHGAACGVLVRGLGEPVPWPREVAVGVVLQLDGGGFRVGFCFEEGAPGSRTLGEVGGEERGERVREEGDDFGRVQYRLGKGGGLKRSQSGAGILVGGEERRTLRVLSRMSTTTLCRVCDRRCASGALRRPGDKKGAHGVTSTSFPAMKGSRMQSKGNLLLS